MKREDAEEHRHVEQARPFSKAEYHARRAKQTRPRRRRMRKAARKQRLAQLKRGR